MPQTKHHIFKSCGSKFETSSDQRNSMACFKRGEQNRNNKNNTGITQKCGVFAKQLLPCKNSKYYIFLCMYARACNWPDARVCACACACVLLLMQHTSCMRHIVVCGLSGSTKLFDIIS
jgi:hypothetical protein